ncbi:MAG TPA: pilus assembly protein PilM [Solirubrobacteraceae bacterium]|jgi:type IV pilus assembly protein PilM|nr:pilus assembly protein PilM [Solirubrobacteraceae bacterium]
MPKLPSPKLRSSKLPSLSLGLSLPGRRSATDVVGLDVQPGLVAAVKASVNGVIRAERAAAQPLDADTMREGEVLDVESLSEALRELFADGGLGKRVRVGIANQRTVMRTLELPPVSDAKELAAAVSFQAQDQVPMPLSNAVLDSHPLGIFDTPNGPRQRVVLVASQRDLVERLLAAVRGAGLTPVGVDLSAFALIRSLHDRAEPDDRRVLYLNVDGLTNLAIAEGTTCRFTRVVGGGVEGMAAELAARRGIALSEARALLATIDLNAPSAPESSIATPIHAPAPAAEADAERSQMDPHTPADAERAANEEEDRDQAAGASREEHETREASMGYAETIQAAQPPAPEPAPERDDADVRAVLENGVRELTGEIRNSIDFHRTQDQGGEISYLSLSGAALDLPGFAETLQASLGMEVRSEAVGLVDASLEGRVSTHRLSVAAGLATVEAPR